MANINNIWKMMETRRRQQVEAAERRRKQEAARGVKDPERVKRMQQKSLEIEQREKEMQQQGGASLKWTTE
ncbi:uncharacterized protein LOC126975643 isoform X2 [Leptidea sinapis]|uniref:uncharacterized protein LOC126975643 isoform X2 n=1 Tax=Leptidea sinapis TaxID=189913 RepID=UPI0021C30C29|nr:uncharacterized protein LOC126975643 isoform X2 [Leptidea sinapis]